MKKKVTAEEMQKKMAKLLLKGEKVVFFEDDANNVYMSDNTYQVTMYRKQEIILDIPEHKKLGSMELFSGAESADPYIYNSKEGFKAKVKDDKTYIIFEKDTYTLAIDKKLLDVLGEEYSKCFYKTDKTRLYIYLDEDCTIIAGMIFGVRL